MTESQLEETLEAVALCLEAHTTAIGLLTAIVKSQQATLEILEEKVNLLQRQTHGVGQPHGDYSL